MVLWTNADLYGTSISIPPLPITPRSAHLPEVIELQRTKGIALQDILQGLHPLVFRVGVPPSVLIPLVKALAAAEHRLAYGTSEKLQLGSIVAAFAVAREGIVAAAR